MNQQDFLAALAASPQPIARLCRELEVPFETVRSWMKRDPEFAAMVRVLREVPNQKKLSVEASEDVPDFLNWRSEHCAYIDPRTGVVHRAVNNWYQQDAWKHLSEHRRLIMVLPPGHIKTTLFGVEHSTWQIQRSRNSRILNIQKNEQEAAKVISAVQQRLSDHAYYEHLAGRLIAQGEEPIINPVALYGGREGYKPKSYRSGEAWGQHAFRVSGVTSGEKDFTMQAKGAGSQIQGIRADKIVLDDIQDPNAISPLNTEKLAEWFQRVILGRLFDWQQLIILGNLFHPTDFMSWLIDNYPDWPVIRYPAITNHETQEVLCPEVWNYEGLMRKKQEVGDSVWHYTWMQAEGTFEDAVFKREALEGARNTDYRLGEVPPQVSHVFIGCDPAISRYCSVVAWGLDMKTGCRYLIDVFNERNLRTFQNIQAQILNFVRAYAPRTVAIEMNNVQGSISSDPNFVKEVRSFGAQVVTYMTRTATGARAETDDFDISSIGALFDSGLVVLPYADPASKKAVDPYIAQMLEWRPGIKHLTRDMVMATLFAESQARDFYIRHQNAIKKKPLSKAPGWARDRSRRWTA